MPFEYVKSRQPMNAINCFLDNPAAMPPKKSPEWDYVDILTPHATNPEVQCTYCDLIFKGGATRIRGHLTGKGEVRACQKVPEDVRLRLSAAAASKDAAVTAKRKREEEHAELTAGPNRAASSVASTSQASWEI
jgi:hypothetical protein